MPAAILTGSDSGIGRASAVLLAQGLGRRHHLARGRSGARQAAEEVRSHGRRAEVRQLDLTDLDEVQDEVGDPETGQEDEDVERKECRAIPLGRPGDAREIGAVVAFSVRQRRRMPAARRS